MKRTALTLTLISALVFSAAVVTMPVNLATANPAPLFPFPWGEPVMTPPTIVVYSPVQNQTFSSTDVWLNFSMIKPETWFPSEDWRSKGYSEGVFGNVTSVYYVVDGGERQNITVHDTDTLFTANAVRTLNFSTNLALTGGVHNVTVSLEADSYYVAGQGFSLSSVVVHGNSETVNFTIAKETIPQPEPAPFPTSLVITASGASLAVAGVGLLVYFKKHNENRRTDDDKQTLQKT